MLGVLALGGRPICFVGTCQQLRRHLCLTWLAPLFPLVLNVVHHSCYYIPPPFCVICLPFLYFSKFTMPRASARLQHKRSQDETTTGATSKRPRRNQQPSQPTIFPSVQSAVTSVDLSTSSPSFNNDLISRLADAVTQRLGQENQPSLTALQGRERNFRAAGIFFVTKFLVWIFFRPLHEYILVLIGVHDFFFSFNFPLREYFFCTSLHCVNFAIPSA